MGRWDELTFEQKRSVIEAITDQIVIGERDIAIHLHYVPSQQDDGNYMKNTLGLFSPGRDLFCRFTLQTPDRQGINRLL